MEHIDTAIIYAASMLADTDSTLNKLFTGMVASKSLLEKVTDRQAVPGKAIWLDPQGARDPGQPRHDDGLRHQGAQSGV